MKERVHHGAQLGMISLLSSILPRCLSQSHVIACATFSSGWGRVRDRERGYTITTDDFNRCGVFGCGGHHVRFTAISIS